MNEQVLARLESMLVSLVSQSAEVLQRQCKESGLAGSISHGSWSNDAGISMAYISCYFDHDAITDAIEVVWQVTHDEGHVSLQGDICYSNGEIIKPLLNLAIDSTDAEYALFQAQSEMEGCLAEALIQLRKLLSC